jgi:predicted transposase YbfD/YdcC
MSVPSAGSLLAYLAQVPDPRGRKGRRHGLSAMLTAVVCGLLCGVRGYEDLVEWLHGLPVDVWHWMGYTRRPPKKDCFRDLLMRLDPEAFERVLRAWIATDLKLSVSEVEVSGVSLDGKTLCGTLRALERAVHLLSAVDHQTGFVLSQSRVDEKTNEHKAALPLLKAMVLQGRVIVGDAMFCQRDVCQQIVESGGDYLVSVKKNQPTLLREISLEFRTAASVEKKGPCPLTDSTSELWNAITRVPSIKDMAASNVGL